MRWTSQAILAASTEDSALGGRSWTTISHMDTRVLNALALWMNSTLGMMTYWTQGQRTHSGRATLQVNGIRKLICPRLDQLEDKTLDWVEEQFHALSRENFLPACQAFCDKTRIRLDSAVISMLSLPPESNEALDRLRKVWCSDASIHGQNKEALKLLREHDLR